MDILCRTRVFWSALRMKMNMDMQITNRAIPQKTVQNTVDQKRIWSVFFLLWISAIVVNFNVWIYIINLDKKLPR